MQEIQSFLTLHVKNCNSASLPLIKYATYITLMKNKKFCMLLDLHFTTYSEA